MALSSLRDSDAFRDGKWLLWASGVIAIAILAGKFGELFDGTLAGLDDMTRLQQVRDLLGGQAWFVVDQTRLHDRHRPTRLDRRAVDAKRTDGAGGDDTGLDVGGDRPFGQHRTTRCEPGAHVDSHQDGGEAQRSILGGKIGPQWDPRRGPRLGAGDGDAVPARDAFERGGHEANASNNMAKK